jgi:hypothetical protein
MLLENKDTEIVSFGMAIPVYFATGAWALGRANNAKSHESRTESFV